MTVGAFVLARLDEDEALADSMLGPPAGHYDKGVQAGYLRLYAYRTLADCEAKRRLVQECRYEIDRKPASPRAVTLARLTLALLAEPWADHPDFQQEWHVG